MPGSHHPGLSLASCPSTDSPARLPCTHPRTQNLEGLFYSHTDFSAWEDLPHGLKYLRTGSEAKFLPILSSRAMQTIVDLELACPIPHHLPFKPNLPQLQKLTYYSVARSSDHVQLDVMRKILDNSPKLRKLVLEILFDDDEYFLHYLPQFFESLTRVELTLYMVTLRKEHCIAESLEKMVSNSPLTIESIIRIPNLSDEELFTMTKWTRLRKLKLYSSTSAFRGTAFSLFVEVMFKQSLVELITTNVVFSKPEQETLLETCRKLSLLVMYEDDFKKPVEHPFLHAFEAEKKFYRMILSKK